METILLNRQPGLSIVFLDLLLRNRSGLNTETLLASLSNKHFFLPNKHSVLYPIQPFKICVQYVWQLIQMDSQFFNYSDKLANMCLI